MQREQRALAASWVQKQGIENDAQHQAQNAKERGSPLSPAFCKQATRKDTQMKLNELIERLQAMARELQDSTGEDDIGERTEVRIASQPSWPLAHDVEAVMAEEESMAEGRKGPVLWLACSATVGYGEHPYAPKYAWNDDQVLTSDDTEEMDS